MQTKVLPLIPLRGMRKITGTLQEVLEQRCEEYVSVTLRDETVTTDAQDRIRDAFPYLLEIRREFVGAADYTTEITVEKQLDPFALCCEFLNNPDEEEQALLRDVINAC